MSYYEFLRARRAFAVFAAIVIAIAVTVYAVAEFHSASAVIKIEVGKHSLHGVSPIVFTSLAAWATAILATVMSTSLNRQRDHLPYTWTRSQSRFEIALGLIAVDLVVLLCAFTLVLAVEMACFLLLSRGAVGIRWDGGIGADLLRAFGFPVMWYAIVQAASAGLRRRNSAIAGLSWPVFIVGASLEAARFPAPWNVVLTFLNMFNPMAYLSGTKISANGDVVLQSFIGFETPVRLVLMYGIACAALYIAIMTWRRMEV